MKIFNNKIFTNYGNDTHPCSPTITMADLAFLQCGLVAVSTKQCCIATGGGWLAMAPIDTIVKIKGGDCDSHSCDCDQDQSNS